jgi:hypothetical protein
MGSGYTIAVPLHTREERRVAERFAAAMPVTVDGHAGTTQDLSRTGLSFLADHPFEVGTRVAVVIEYLLDGHRYPLRCEAEVVRVTPEPDGNYSIGARLSPQSTLQDVAVAGEPPGAGDGADGPRLRRVT